MKEINWNEIVVDCDFHGWLCSDCIKAKEVVTYSLSRDDC